MRGGTSFMQKLAGILGRSAILLLVMAGAARGQEPELVLSRGVSEAGKFVSVRLMQDVELASQNGTPSGQNAPAAKPVKPIAHRFWDTQNILLFAGVGAARGLDYA